MKTFFKSCVLALLPLMPLHAQVLTTNSGDVSFFSETPVENISAENKNVLAAINIDTKEVAVKIQNRAFQFGNKLMQEHFNENYMETEKYPISSFKGKILDDINLQKEGIYKVKIKGILDIHGVKKDNTFDAVITVNSNTISVTCNFEVKLVDYKIDVPKLVFEKIAENITIKNKFIFIPKRN